MKFSTFWPWLWSR